MTSEKDEKSRMGELIHSVSTIVNPARINIDDTICHMSYEDIRREIIQARAGRLREARMAAGFRSAAAAAQRNRWVEATYRSHENGTRKIDDEDAERYASGFSKSGRKVTGLWIIYGPQDEAPETSEKAPNSVPVMGLIGAGATIEPEYEQIPEHGIYQIQLPFAVPDELIALQVDGESMMPYYEDGDIVIVWKEQKKNLEDYYGQLAAVRTLDGKRYLKEIQPGRSRSVVNLISFNAKPIINVRLEWIGEICMWMKKDQVHRVAARVGRRLTGTATVKHK